MRCVICAIAKNENLYLYEWAQYHIALGFEHIYLYDNNDIDGENPIDVFRNTHLQDKVTILNYRGKRYQQMIAYQHCLTTYQYDWCAYIDIDEFITFAPNSEFNDINDFLRSFSPDVECIHLNWLCYGDNGHIFKQKQVCSSYTMPIQPIDFKFTYDDVAENDHIKSIVRGGVSCRWLPIGGEVMTPHSPAGLNCVANVWGG